MTRAALFPALCCTLILALFWAVAQGFAGLLVHATNADSPASQQNQPTLRYYSSNTCATAGCHYQDKPFDGKGLQPICRCKEMEFWDLKDKHKIALSVLLDERSKRMGTLLGIKNVATDQRCVSCHGVWIEPENLAKADEEFTKLDTRVKEGVTCIVCHGSYKEWFEKHYTPDARDRLEWRTRSRPEKENAYGMYDLWNPVKRTQLCASCHIGNADKGRLVTHEMYAAGHPPLPGFEVVTFSNQMPRHWQYLKEKDDSILKLLKFNKREAELEETHLLAIGALVGFQETMKLLNAQAAGKNWPELAHFDCYACHHELRSQSWRQQRGYAGRPGRPPLREWPTTLVELGLAHAAKDTSEHDNLSAEFYSRLGALQDVLDAQPFGDPARVRIIADDFNKWLTARIDSIGGRIAQGEQPGGYTADASADLLKFLVALPERSNPTGRKRPSPDFDSARQLAWAYQVLYLEAKSKHDPKERDKRKDEMYANPAWKILDEYLRLTLPPGQIKLESSFSASLERIGSFEPREYKNRLDAVVKQFKLP